MTDTDISARLRASSVGVEEWAVVDPATGAYSMWFDRNGSANPAREAAKWLELHKHKWPEKFATYEVVHGRRQDERDRLEIAAADEIDRLRGEVEALKVDAERYRWLRERKVRATLWKALDGASISLKLRTVRCAPGWPKFLGSPGSQLKNL